MDYSLRFNGNLVQPCEPCSAPRAQARFETTWSLPQEVGHGTIKHYELARGFTLFTSHYMLHAPLTFQVECAHAAFGFGFCLSGRFKGCSVGMRNTVASRAGQCVTRYYANQTGTVKNESCGFYQLVSILVDPEHLYARLQDNVAMLPRSLRHLAYDDAETALCHRGELSPQMYSVLGRILHYPHADFAEGLFLEGSAMELIALNIHAMNGQRRERCVGRLPTKDVRKLHEAAEILASDMEHPPTLFELSKSVGLSHVKLNRGFRQEFGATVFGYLRRIRLQKAKQLMEIQGMNVTEAAFSVGYSSLSSFSKAFSEQYGMQPRSYLK